MYELPHELPNDIRLEISKMLDLIASTHPTTLKSNFDVLGKNLAKNQLSNIPQKNLFWPLKFLQDM